MGRPLKIKQSTTVDIGFPAFGDLTAPVYPTTPPVINSTQYLGVVGGANASIASTSYPVIKARVYIAGMGAEEDGYIITQKGSTKYLVGGATARTALVSGQAYRITVVGNTDWNSYGVTGTPAVGQIFTATAALANTGTGRVNAVGVCTLANLADSSLTSGSMNITFTLNDSTATRVQRLTNKYVLDYSNNRYVINFFTDEGSEIKSGGEAATFSGGTAALSLAIVENYTS